MTQIETILVALTKAADAFETEAAFSLSDLVVLAWKENKSMFGLFGHEEHYPNSKRVLNTLYRHNNGYSLISKKWIEFVPGELKVKTIRLTQSGIQKAREAIQRSNNHESSQVQRMPESNSYGEIGSSAGN